MRHASADAPAPAPRPFPWRAIDVTTGLLLLLGVAWLAIGTVVSATLIRCRRTYWDDPILDRRSDAAPALPTSVDPTSGRDQRTENLAHQLHLHRRRGGDACPSSTQTLSHLIVLRARRGAPLEIEYDPRAPERSRMRGERGSVTGIPGLIPFAIAIAAA